MPVVEKYGLMVLFGLCAVIVGVGIFAEDPLTEQALQQNQESHAKVEVLDNSGHPSPTYDDSLGEGRQTDPFPGLDDDQQSANPGLAYYPQEQRGGGSEDLDPERTQSFPDPAGPQGILEKPRKVKPRVAPKPKPKTALRYRSYRVKKGDSLSLIAKKQMGSPKFTDAIRQANPQIKGDKVILGKMIQIPVLGVSKQPGVARKRPVRKNKSQKGHYIRVKKGQSLITIAKREYGDENKWKALAKRNGIKNPKKLKERQKLFIPSEL